ncbi:MAG: glycosyltransferase family 2 protein [Ignavibacteriae bacterium]|nr:glycosyltransferase family 2 protein [Ignavibacteriota bacterium]
MLSVTIICKNEEENIRECLESVKWADEIIVVDGLSTDKTAEIAKEYTDKIFTEEWKGFARQRESALLKTSNEWIFPIDADERCTPELKNEILEVIKSGKGPAGYRIPRKTFFLGKWIKHCGWYPGYQTRLFQKSRTRVTDRLVHEGYEVDGEQGYLKGDILHYSVTSITDYMRKVNQYSSLQAVEKANKKEIKFSDLLLRPVAAHIQNFIFKKGFLDGVHGLMVTNFDIITNMLTYMKAWEIQKKKKAGK